MRRYWDDIPFYSQPTVQELKERAAATVRKESAKGNQLEPVIIEGRTIATSWWGRAWCENLERYADYSSRLSRGKRYVRTGSVLDLKISKGKILARVQGSRRTPYKVEIRISPLAEETCQSIIRQCGQRLENLETLLAGDFPQDLKNLFQGSPGLFPTPREISFQCSCPDWALMCKHVAAVLYGIGARLDQNPLLFFTLRGIDVGKFIDVTLADHVETMLSHVDNVTDRMMDDDSASSLFGVL